MNSPETVTEMNSPETVTEMNSPETVTEMNSPETVTEMNSPERCCNNYLNTLKVDLVSSRAHHSCASLFCSPESKILRRDDACFQLEGCILPLGLLEFYYHEGVYETFCQAEVTFKNCVEDFRPRCNDDSVTIGVQSLLAAGEFICSTEGSQVIHAAAQSDCITNTTKKLEIDTKFHTCVTVTERAWEAAAMNALANGEAFGEDDYCTFIEQALTCITTYINENCGAIYGDFVRELVQRTTRPRLSCEMMARHVRRFVDAI